MLALLRLAATPDSVQSDEALRRVINTPARGFGAKAMDELEQEAAWRKVSLLAALETANLPPKTRLAGLAFVDAIRGVCRDPNATLADQVSLLLGVTGYRAMLRESRAETTEDRLENVQEPIQLAGSFHSARVARPRGAILRRPERERRGPRAADDAAQGQRIGVRPRLPAGLGGGRSRRITRHPTKKKAMPSRT